MTRDKSLWIHLLRVQEKIFHLPLDQWSGSTPSLVDLPAADIEFRVRSANSIANAWPLPRKSNAVKLLPKSSESSILGLQVFLDRWLLSVYSEGLLYLWDLKYKKTGIRCASLDLGSKRWTSFTAALEPGRTAIMIAVTSASS